MRSATSTFGGTPSSVPSARRWVLATLREWGLDETGWTAAQVVSELATNCTLHARSVFTLRLSLDTGCVRLEVEDESPVPLQARSYSPTATTGRGLGIVDTLAARWGVTTTDAGKTVWVLLAVEDADTVPPDEEQDAHAGPARGGGPGASAGVAARGAASASAVAVAA